MTGAWRRVCNISFPISTAQSEVGFWSGLLCCLAGIICLNVMDDGLDATVTETLNHKLQSHKALQPPKVQLNSCTHDTAKV